MALFKTFCFAMPIYPGFMFRMFLTPNESIIKCSLLRQISFSKEDNIFQSKEGLTRITTPKTKYRYYFCMKGMTKSKVRCEL